MVVKNKFLLFFGIFSIIGSLYLFYFNNKSPIDLLLWVTIGFGLINESLFFKKGYIKKKEHVYGLWITLIVLLMLLAYTYITRPYYFKNIGFLIISGIIFLCVFTGAIYEHRKIMKYQTEVRHYQETLEFNPEDSTAWNNKGTVAADFKAYNEALEYFDRALEIDSEDSAALHNKGVILTKQRKEQEAMTYLDKALKFDPRFENAKRAGKIILET